jgi:CTP:molybdopterin cytidylyltransferase MocA
MNSTNSKNSINPINAINPKNSINSTNPKNSIPVVILCGGMGTRLREETEYKPKPMVEIGGKPVLWHIMKHYAHFGFMNSILPWDTRESKSNDISLTFIV